MIEILDILKEQLKARFVANAAICQIDENIRLYTKDLIFEKYKGIILYRNGLQFELNCVKVSCGNSYSNKILPRNIYVGLVYFCVSNLPKTKRERLEKAKEYFKKHDSLDWTTSPNPTWFKNRYELELEDVLKGNVDLLIE